MLVTLPAVRRAGLRRRRLFCWRAIDADPQFVFAVKVTRASFLVIDLSNADRRLDPRIYLDHGKGFEPADEIELRPTQDGIYVVALKSWPAVHRVRFDPATYPAAFELRVFAGYSEKSVRAHVGRRLRAAARGEGANPPICEIIAARDAADALTGLGLRARKIRGVVQHFEQALAMAGAHFADAPPWTGDVPLVSFISPLYNTPALYLDQLLASFRMQRPGAWELILSDDGSNSRETASWLDRNGDAPGVTVVRAPANGGIAAATNRGLARARGEWVGLVDHDDALAPFALDAILEALRDNPQAQFLYTDEAVTDARLTPTSCFFKPAFDPVLLSGVNYINHLSLYRRSRLMELGGLRGGFDGSQDYDLLLRYLAGLDRNCVLHLPYPAYLWRRDGKSFSAAFGARATDAARRALAEAWGAPVGPALDPNLHKVALTPARWPSISVVIPSKNAFPLISRLFEDLVRRTDYPDLEIIVADNGSTDPRVLALYESMRAKHPRFIAEITPAPFDFSAQTNRGARLASGEAILLLNNDIEVMEPGWLKEMASCLAFPQTGVVGARLLYPDGTLQHAGVIAGLGSVAGHWFCGLPKDLPGPMGRLRVRSSHAAVTGACLLTSRACWEATGGLDAAALPIAYNDIDYCLRAGRLGFGVVWTPFATLYHHESASRGSDETKENIDRFRREQEVLRERWGLVDYEDPAFSPWYARDSGVPRPLLPVRLPKARRFAV